MAGALLVVLAGFFTAPGESTARMAYGLDLVGSSPEATARAFLSESASTFGLGPQDALKLVSSDGDVLVFERLRAGFPVFGHEVKATFDARGHLVMVYVGAPLPPAQGAFLVDVSRAERVAGRGLDGAQLLDSR